MYKNESTQTQQSVKLSRRSILKTSSVLFGSLNAAKWLSADDSDNEPTSRIVYVGGYGLGIYICLMDNKGNLTQTGLTTASSPSFLAFNKQKTILYTINEITAGTASAYKINATTGALTFINAVPCANTLAASNGPAHVSVHASGKYLLTSQYGGASLSAISINADGSLGAVTDTVLHTGSLGPGQTQAHPHMTVSDPSGKYVISQDLGQDRTYIYVLDANGKFSPGPMPFAQSQPGSGPRHVAFHPDGIHMYSICEPGGIINVYLWSPNSGMLYLEQTVSTLPAGYTGHIQASEVIVSADGDTVYGANRGFDSIARFSVKESGATLSQAQASFTWTRGETPRHFNIDPSGCFLLAGNQTTNNITTFSVGEDGNLSFANEFFGNLSPACILFL